MEFGQMCGIHGLIPENPVDTEHLCGLESSRLVCNLVEHGGGDGSGVGTENKTLCLCLGERVAVSSRSISSFLVDVLDSLVVVFWVSFRGNRVYFERVSVRR